MARAAWWITVLVSNEASNMYAKYSLVSDRPSCCWRHPYEARAYGLGLTALSRRGVRGAQGEPHQYCAWACPWFGAIRRSGFSG